MIILDTNVLSALARPSPDVAVERWLDRQQQELIWTTAITTYEVRAGIDRLPEGRRRSELEQAWSALLGAMLGHRVLPFDSAAAEIAGALLAARIGMGFTDDHRDLQIAGIARSTGAIVATRNTRHFSGLGVPLVNPWEFTA